MVFPIQLPNDAPFNVAQRAWLSDFLTKVLALGNPAATTHGPSVPVPVVHGSQTGTAEKGYSKSRPFPAPVVENSNLNGPGEKQTYQVALSLDGSDLTYEVGDALGVYPLNPPDVVDEIIANLPFKASDVPTPDGGEVSLREGLAQQVDDPEMAGKKRLVVSPLARRGG